MEPPPGVEFLESVTCECVGQALCFSFTASQILYGPSHLKDNFRNMSFSLLVSFSKTMLPAASSSSQIPYFRSGLMVLLDEVFCPIKPGLM